MYDQRSTLTQFIIEEQRRVAGASGDFSALLNDIATACKSISHAISRGSLGTDARDLQSHLEGRARQAIVQANAWTGRLAAMSSAQEEAPIAIPEPHPKGKYLLTFNALNGSGNLDINFMSGTIFSVLRAPAAGGSARAEDFLQPGTAQVAAGFVLYGASTRLVLSLGRGVNGFMLDREIGEFVLTQPNMQVPADAATFAINASNERFWEPPVRRYVQECMAGQSGPRGRDFGMRWVASLIAEAYRVLVRGGVFLYPVSGKAGEEGGRLHLIHEANPIAYLIEQAGGAAITGRNRILEVTPSALHQRAPFIFGSRGEIERIHQYHRDYIEGRDHNSYDDLPLFGSRSLFRDA